MQHVETTISQHAIHVRYADAANPADAEQLIDVQVKLSAAKIVEPELQYLAELRVAALGHVLQLIQGEIRRLKNSGRATG
jgi:hypothetical protein